MFMKELFVKQFIPNAKPVNIFQNKGIFFFENASAFFVLIDVTVEGSFTQTLQQKIISEVMQLLTKPIKFISLYKTRTNFASTDEIVWGTYAWFENEPTHFIHFDDNPSKNFLKAR